MWLCFVTPLHASCYFASKSLLHASSLCACTSSPHKPASSPAHLHCCLAYLPHCFTSCHIATYFETASLASATCCITHTVVTLQNQHNSWPEHSVNQPTSFQAPFEAKKGEQPPPQSLKVENEDLEAFELQRMTDERRHDTLVAPRQTRQRVFRQAQEKTSTLLPAPFVSVESRTTSEPAKRKHDGMESLLYTAEIRTIASSTARGSSFAQTGSDQRDVLENTVTNVPDVAVEVMEPTIAHLRNLEITTPL